MTLNPGLIGQAELVVGTPDTAVAIGSGDVPVLATPRVVALAEAATVAAVRDHLPGGTTTVGTRVEFDHLAATPIGVHVTAEAVLVAADGRHQVFEVVVRAAGAVVATGRVERVAVDRDRFLARASGVATKGRP